MNITRRDFVRTVLASPMLAGWAYADEKPGFPGMIVRAEQPRNLEFPIAALKGTITPNEHFYVRSHFAVPEIDAKIWKLNIEGAIEKELELTIDDVAKLPASKLTATVECAGNGRVHLTPAVPGLQWGDGAIGNALWEGVALAAILKQVRPMKNAVEVILEGTDMGQINADPKSPGPVHFARSLPIEKAMGDHVLLAHKMNGEPLPKSHGFPLRAVVGGWYGMASVKWLKRIIVSDKPFRGFFQSLDYSYFERRDGLPTLLPVTAAQPKAIVAHPALSEIIPAGKAYRVFGAAWAGEQAVKKVEVSVDGGKTWSNAKLLGEPKPIQWVLWEYVWDKPASGKAAIIAKATDDQGRTQPPTRNADRRSYMINHLVPVAVTVR